jgi:outer membrane protein assembly factor BamB
MDHAITASPPAPRTAPALPRHRWFPILTVLVAPTLIVLYSGIVGHVFPGTWIVFDLRTFAILVAAGSAVALLGWFVLLSGYSPATRWGTLAALVVLGAVGCLAASPFVRFDGFDGGMMPRFHLATTPLPVPVDAKGIGEGVDLVTTTPDDFPQFMGPHRDNMIPNVRLATDWETSPPRLLWKQPIGEGWAGFAVVGNHAITIQQRGPEEWTTCHDLKTGALEWKNTLAGRHTNAVGGIGPRSTPTVEGGRVYVMHAIGTLRCLDGKDGKTLWEHDLVTEFGSNPGDETAQMSWGRSASPLIYENAVIVPAGGPGGDENVAIVAYDKVTGARLWQGGHRTPSYASPSLAVLGGVPQILLVSQDHIDSFDAKSGDHLWDVGWNGSSSGNANVSNARQIGPDRVFISKAYGIGAKLMQVTRPDGKWKIEPVWANNRTLKTKFSNVVVKDGFIYGLSESALECADVEKGKRRWSGSRFGYGQILGVGDELLVLSEEGEVVLVDLSPDEETIRCRFQALDSITGITWNPPALAGKYLVVRNAHQAACYELPLK